MSATATQVVWRSDIDTSALRGSAGEHAVYAIGDIHGCYDLALALLAAIADDVVTLPASLKPLIVFCGDYVDRGTRSADVLSMLVWMLRQAPCDVVFLKGNHEAMLLAFIAAPREALGWLKHGGDATLRSYGIAVDQDASLEEQCEKLRDALLDRMPASHLDVLHRLAITQPVGDYLLVHAGLRPGVALTQQSEDDCLWIREGFVDSDEDLEALVVHGHTWESTEPVVTRTRIGIDTGAYKTGVLTAVKLVASSVQFLQAISPKPTVERPS